MMAGELANPQRKTSSRWLTFCQAPNHPGVTEVVAHAVGPLSLEEVALEVDQVDLSHAGVAAALADVILNQLNGWRIAF